MSDFNFGIRLKAYTKEFTQKIKTASLSVKSGYKDMVSEARVAREELKRQFEAGNKDAGILARGINGVKASIVGLGVGVASFVGFTTLKNSMLAVIETGAKFEQLETKLKAVMGSIEGGEKATAWIKDFAKNTPFQLEGLTEGFIKLRAFGIDPMNGSYQAIADQVAKLGGGQQELEGIVLAVGQAWTKQKLQTEEANQLIERGVPVWELLSKSMGKSTAEIQKLAEKGQLGRKEIQLLIDTMGQSAEGAAAAQMGTWNGMISNLKDSWTSFVNDIAEAGFFDFAKTQLQEVMDLIGQMAKDGRLKAYAQDISKVLVNVGAKVKSFVSLTIENFQTVSRAANIVIGSIRFVFNSFSAGISTIVAAVTNNLSILMQGVSKAAEFVGMEEISAKFNTAAEALKDISRNAVLQLEQDSKDIKAALEQINSQSLEKAKDEIRDVGDTSQEAAKKVDQSANQMVNSFEKVSSAANTAKTAADGISISTEGIKKHLEALDKAAKSQKKKTEATDQDSKSVDKNTEATDKNTESVRANRGAALTLAGKTSAAWAAASEEMGAAYDRLTQGMANAVNKFGRLPRAAFSYVKDFAKAYWDAEAAAQRLQAQYTQQEQSLNNHLRALTDSEHVTEAMVNKAEQALGAYTLLGDQQLAPLRNAIATIKADMDQLTDSLENTVDSLRDELDRLNGDTVAIQDRAYQRERDRLKDLADKAKQQRNDEAIREAQEALRLLEQTYRIKRENAKNEQQSAQPTNSANTPSRTVRLELDNNGQPITGDFDSEEQAKAFVNAVNKHRWASA